MNKVKISALIFAIVLGNRVSFAYAACPSKEYTIGIQAIDYTPHYNDVTTDKSDFFSLFVDWLAIKTGCDFNVIALPIKRLNLTFEKRGVDFIYPDNPNWHSQSHVSRRFVRHYSPPLTVALGSTIVKVENKEVALSDFDELAIPRGFSPVAWYPLQKQYPIKFREVSDAEAALLMVQTNRVSGADIEYNVAQHIIKKHGLVPMTVGKHLPYTPTGFHLATATQPEMLKTISELINTHQDDIKQMRDAVNLLEALPENELTRQLSNDSSQ